MSQVVTCRFAGYRIQLLVLFAAINWNFNLLKSDSASSPTEVCTGHGLVPTAVSLTSEQIEIYFGAMLVDPCSTVYGRHIRLQKSLTSKAFTKLAE